MLQPAQPRDRGRRRCGASPRPARPESPKGVVLSRAAIRASVQATQARLGGPGDWVLALPTHYVAGLMVLARAHRRRHRVATVSVRSGRPAPVAGHAGCAALHLVGARRSSTGHLAAAI